MEKNARTFLPRMNGPIVWVETTAEWTLISMNDNSISVVANGGLAISKTLCGFSKNLSGTYNAGLSCDSNTNSIVSNGKSGFLQMYRYPSRNLLQLRNFSTNYKKVEIFISVKIKSFLIYHFKSGEWQRRLSLRRNRWKYYFNLRDSFKRSRSWTRDHFERPNGHGRPNWWWFYETTWYDSNLEIWR